MSFPSKFSVRPQKSIAFDGKAYATQSLRNPEHAFGLANHGYWKTSEVNSAIWYCWESPKKVTMFQLGRTPLDEAPKGFDFIGSSKADVGTWEERDWQVLKSVKKAEHVFYTFGIPRNHQMFRKCYGFRLTKKSGEPSLYMVKIQMWGEI